MPIETASGECGAGDWAATLNSVTPFGFSMAPDDGGVGERAQDDRTIGRARPCHVEYNAVGIPLSLCTIAHAYIIERRSKYSFLRLNFRRRKSTCKGQSL